MVMLLVEIMAIFLICKNLKMGRIVAQNGGAGCLQARINAMGGIHAVSKCRAEHLSWNREDTAVWPAPTYYVGIGGFMRATACLRGR